MRKTATLGIVVMFVLALGTICLAQTEKQETGHMGHMMSGQGMKGMMDQNMMTCGMMNRSMVPTEDGGIVVMIGNKLYKYDKDLNLKKEVEMEIGYSEMHNMMKKMHTMGTVTEKEKEK